MSLTDLAAGKYVSLTTYKRDGSTSATPVWVVDLGDGRIGFTTELDSLKVKRIRNDQRVTVQACGMRGKVTDDSSPIDAVAAVVDGAEYEQVRSLVAKKYGLQFKAMVGLGKLTAKLGKGSEGASSAIVISPGS